MFENRDYGFHMYIRGIILIGFSLLMFKLILTGNIHNFIAPRMMPFIYFATAVFLLLGTIQIWRSGSKKTEELYCDCGIDHTTGGSSVRSVIIYSMFILPVVTGFLFSDNVLDSTVAAKRGIRYGSGLFTKPPSIEENGGMDQVENKDLAEEYLKDPEGYMKELEQKVKETPIESSENVENPQPSEDNYEQLERTLTGMEKIIVTDDKYLQMMNIIDTNVDQFVGKELEIVGFVYREPDFNKNQIVVARFGVSCCVADASVYGMMAEGNEAEKLEIDEWVKVTGVIGKTTYYDSEIPYLTIKKVEKVQQPEDPYIYEMY
jgi:putative membrane protein